MRKIIVAALFMLIMALYGVGNPVSTKEVKAYEYKLSKSQQKNADIIAEITSKNWEKYGCLPSVAIAQAYIESQLGVQIPNRGNLWGIMSGKKYYGSVEEGCYGYMRVINNGYYGSAPHTKDWRSQIRKILDGGYCSPEGTYYSDVVWTIETYGLEKYDKKMFKEIKEKKEREKEKKRLEAEKKRKEKIRKRNEKIRNNLISRDFIVVFDSSLGPNEIAFNDPNTLPNLPNNQGCILMQQSVNNIKPLAIDLLPNYFDISKTYSVELKHNEIATGNVLLTGQLVNLDWIYDAVG